MYLDFFKFKKNPFHITPDPDFLFLSPSHQDAYTSIFWGIQQRKGLVAVTGEVGVGKTTILRSYLEGADPERIRTVYIFHAALSFGKLMKQIVSQLGIPAVDKGLPDIIDRVFLYLADEYKNDRRVVLIIDEAQNLPVETLERFRMLSNRETSQEKLLQVILVGQPEFENKLNLPELRQLKQQIAISTRIKTLTPDESLAYIQHRLMIASSFYNPVFTKAALKRIVKEANGIPRTINIFVRQCAYYGLRVSAQARGCQNHRRGDQGFTRRTTGTFIQLENCLGPDSGCVLWTGRGRLGDTFED